MKKENYYCDAGCVLVMCGGSRIMIPNEYGDCYSSVYVGNEADFKAYKEEHKRYGMEERDYHYWAMFDFKDAKVMAYDCLKEPKNVPALFTLNGTYAIYILKGKVYFVKNE